MPRAGLLAGVAGAAFLVFLVAGVPARLLPALFPGELRLSNAAGTLWSGEASALRFGQLQLGKTRWQLRAWRLLTGTLAARIDAQLPGGFARGDVALGYGGRVRLFDFSAASPLEGLAPLLGSSLPIQQGQLSVRLDVLDWQEDWPRRVVGELRLGQVSLVYRAGRPMPSQASNFVLTFAADEVPAGAPLEGSLRDQGGPVAVEAVLRLTPPRNYELSGRAEARDGAPSEMSQALSMLGPASPAGGHDFTFAGSF